MVNIKNKYYINEYLYTHILLEPIYIFTFTYIDIYIYTYIHKKLKINRYIHILSYIESAMKVLHNIIIFTPVIYVRHLTIVEFALLVQDLLINESAQGFLNRQNPFLW